MNDTTKITARAYAYILGSDFARELNASPREAQNWKALDDRDDLPEHDWKALNDRFGFVTYDASAAYRAGFNEHFHG